MSSEKGDVRALKKEDLDQHERGVPWDKDRGRAAGTCSRNNCLTGHLAPSCWYPGTPTSWLDLGSPGQWKTPYNLTTGLVKGPPVSRLWLQAGFLPEPHFLLNEYKNLSPAEFWQH